MQNKSEILLKLPYPPSLNSYYKPNHFGGIYVASAGKQYRKEVAVLVKQHTKCCLHIKSPVELIIKIYPPDKRRRDIDNILKCLLDAIEDSGVIENDNQIYKMTVERKNEKNGCVEIKIIYETE